MTTLTHTIHLYAVKYSWEESWLLRASDSPNMAEVSDAQSQWVYLEPRELSADLPSERILAVAQIEVLRKTQEKLAAEHRAAHTRIEEAIQSLLALPAP